MTRATYIHGTAPDEQARLAALNGLTNASFIAFLDVPLGARVLDVGSGLGLLARDVAASAGRCVVGLEHAAEQLASALRTPSVAEVRGDAHDLPFQDGSFDVVYARYVLEHLADPVAALTEMRRVTCAGGRVAVLENDTSLVRFDPPCPVFEEVWAAFAGLQTQLGGDALIGRRLHRLLRAAGFTTIELSVQPESHWYGSPRFAAWVANIIGNIASARRALIEAGLCSGTAVDEAMAELSALANCPDASAGFAWNRALART